MNDKINLDNEMVQHEGQSTRPVIAVSAERPVPAGPVSSRTATKLYCKKRNWWIRYELDGAQIVRPLDTRHLHIARIRQDEIETELSATHPGSPVTSVDALYHGFSRFQTEQSLSS